jgi:hypothetical protein
MKTQIFQIKINLSWQYKTKIKMFKINLMKILKWNVIIEVKKKQKKKKLKSNVKRLKIFKRILIQMKF